MLLALSRIGFSIDDIRRMTMSDAVTIIDLYLDGAKPSTDAVSHEATQEDIDMLLA